jgi:glycine/D-amino acid oxidase-like deaminating enzyme/nitrite reductase/ring-hydroxylating ferredoxin subunit
MTTQARSSSPYWADSGDFPDFASIDADLHVDVVVIGGGLTGLTTAYLLTKQGLHVAVLERRRCVEVDTASTSAHLTAVTDVHLSALLDAFGDDHARAAWDAGLAALGTIEDNVQTLGISCGFARVPGYLHANPFVRPSEDDRELLRREADTAVALGFDARFVDRLPFIERAAVEFPNQARFHPRQYLSALARAVVSAGGAIFEESAVEHVLDEPLGVQSRGHTITCGWVVVATHNPIVGKAGILSATLLQTKLSLYSTYVIGGWIPRGSVPDGLFWELADPYHYLRIDRHPAADYVLFGGEDHKTGQETDPEECYTRLERALRPFCPNVEITHRWSGQVIETPDGLPYIGEMAPRQFAATGFSGNGMTFGTLAAMMAADAVTGRRNPWAALFDVNRTAIRGGLWDYLKENKDYPYYLIRDRITRPETRTLSTIPSGAGQIVEVDGRRVAAFRDDDGRLTVLSATCTHMGCQVEWNSAERTWDCPCHGSRFQPTGAVISGPAESPLETIDLKTRD